MNFRAGLNRSVNVIIILTAVAAGLWLPHLPTVGSLTVPIVAFLVYISLRGVTFQQVSSVARPRPIVVGLLVSYVVLPATAHALAPILSEPSNRLGLYVIAAVPTTAGSSIVWTKLSGGDVELASILAVASIAISPMATPLILSFFQGSVMTLSPQAVIADLLLIISGGVILRLVIPGDTLTERQVDNSARLSIATLVYISVSQLSVGQLSTNLAMVVVAVIALLVNGFLMSLALHRLSGLAQATRSAVFFSGSLKNLGVGLLIVDILSVPAAAVVVVIYYLCQQLVGAFAADMFFPRPAITLNITEASE
jgi:predicted Na+-dependent transporter